jgi:hypothetical protein
MLRIVEADSGRETAVAGGISRMARCRRREVFDILYFVELSDVIVRGPPACGGKTSGGSPAVLPGNGLLDGNR